MSSYFYSTREATRKGFHHGFLRLRKSLRTDDYPRSRRQKYSLAYRSGSSRGTGVIGFEMLSYILIIAAYLIVFITIVS